MDQDINNNPPSYTMRLANSASDQNVYFTYVCQVNDVKPIDQMFIGSGPNSVHVVTPPRAADDVILDQDTPEIQVERSKAVHELVESSQKYGSPMKDGEKTAQETINSSIPYPTNISEDSDSEMDEFNGFKNPKILKLTKMKWLSEGQTGCHSSTTSLSPAMSTTSTCSQESTTSLKSQDEKVLTTVLRLDKEHNLFGLSNIAIVGSKQSKRKKDDEKPAFPQKAIVQVCCGAPVCCRNKSRTDLPNSLKCRAPPCYQVPCCLPCTTSGCTKCCTPPGKPSCGSVCSSCKSACPPGKNKCCAPRCNPCFGLSVQIHRKYKYESEPLEITPRASCILKIPAMARTCHHTPRCCPPSSCFPYLMPCFWPARASAPCNEPKRCFHNPPCPPAKIKPAWTPCCGKRVKPCMDKKCHDLNCPGVQKTVINFNEFNKPSAHPPAHPPKA